MMQLIDHRFANLLCGGLALAVLLSAQSVSVEPSADAEAPNLKVDLFSSTRIYPDGDAVLMGFAMGVVWRPTDKCVHLAGEGFARFGSRNASSGEEIDMRTAGGALGALWGNGDANRWFGAGAMFDMGWARVGPVDHFVLGADLRALLYWRLRKEFWVGLDARAGYVIVPVTAEQIGIEGPTVGLGIGLIWGDDGGYGSS
ncbi:MAG: hypothetical protein WCE62_04805 [Polyangiales bacterium]